MGRVGNGEGVCKPEARLWIVGQGLVLDLRGLFKYTPFVRVL